MLQSALEVERQVIGWFSVKHPDPECCTPSGKFPVFLLQDEQDCYYGFPQFGHNGLKIGKFDRENTAVAHPSQLERRVLAEDEQVMYGVHRAAFVKHVEDVPEQSVELLALQCWALPVS